MSFALVFTDAYNRRALGGKHQGVHSVSINLSYRITLELMISDEQIILVNIGDHDTVY